MWASVVKRRSGRNGRHGHRSGRQAASQDLAGSTVDARAAFPAAWKAGECKDCANNIRGHHEDKQRPRAPSQANARA